MKKYFALILTALVLMTTFSACKGNWKGGELITERGGKEYAAVTNENGGIVRDDAGNIVVMVTDKNGNNVKGENGEYATNQVGIDHALQVGNRMEMPGYSINIPSGWSNEKSHSTLSLAKDGSADKLKIMTISAADKTLAQKRDENHVLIKAAETNNADAVTVNKAVTLAVGEANLVSVYSETASTYLGYITYRRNSTIYNVMITSDHDVSKDIDDFIKIIDTIEYAN